MSISERIFIRLSELGMTQIEFSRQTGISTSTINDWKRKKTNPSADKLIVICRVLGMSPEELLEDTRGMHEDICENMRGTLPKEMPEHVCDYLTDEERVLEILRRSDTATCRRIAAYLQRLLEE